MEKSVIRAAIITVSDLRARMTIRQISGDFVGYNYGLRFMGIVDAAACDAYRKK